MKAKNKLLTVLLVLILLLILSGLNAFKPKRAAGSGALSSGTDERAYKVKSLGGIKTKMPENSAMVFFGSTLGTTLSNYKAYSNTDEVLCALRSGEVDAIWACDVTADFLEAVNSDLVVFEPASEADIQKTEDARFEFAMALKDTERSVKLRDDINGVLKEIKEDGYLDVLINSLIENAPEQEKLPEGLRFDELSMHQDGRKETIYVGISGAVGPIELLNGDGKPYGFCVALMEEIGKRLNRRIEFVVLDNETSFTSLMSGKVDLLFCYGTGRKTTENKTPYITTDGYYKMQKYKFLKIK